MKEEPQVPLVFKKEQDKCCELAEETIQSSISHESVKQDFHLENMKEKEQAVLDISHCKVENSKNEYQYLACMKEELTTEKHVKWKHEDIKYDIDIEEHKVHNIVDNDNSSVKSIIEGSNRTNNKNERSNFLALDAVEFRKPTNGLHCAITKRYCKECHKHFSRASGLKRHINVVHNGVKSYECQECHKMFSQTDNLKTHINRIHERMTNFKCNICHKMFSSAANVIMHTNSVHKGIKNYECNVCHKMFSQSSSLKTHINIVHMGIRNFECDYCHKMFSKAYSLKKHINGVHKGIKNYECNECHKVFLFLRDLRRHINRVYKCINSKSKACGTSKFSQLHISEEFNKMCQTVKNYDCN